jgi:monoterpene epsilon-lactone hydrolase
MHIHLDFLIYLLSIGIGVSLNASLANYEITATAQATANAKSGLRHVPERDIPVPTVDVSPQEQTIIAGPYTAVFNTHPKSPDEWKELVAKYSADSIAELSDLKKKLGVTVTPTTIAGVKTFIVSPNKLPEKNKNRLLVHVHGGGYIFGSGETGLDEAVFMAGFGGFKIISVDYRMPPDFPFPAALDDAMTVWKEAVKMADPKNMAIFGTSTGGGLTLAMILRAKDEKLPLPAAIAPGTPWADLTNTGDSYKANEWLDNVLVTWSGWLGDAAKLYAGNYNMKEPYLSPIYGDFNGFPPAILTSGTRDLFLSNTVRTHRKLRRAGVEAELNVYEGQSHAQYQVDADAPETKEAFTDIANFFDKHLGK